MELKRQRTIRVKNTSNRNRLWFADSDEGLGYKHFRLWFWREKISSRRGRLTSTQLCFFGTTSETISNYRSEILCWMSYVRWHWKWYSQQNDLFHFLIWDILLCMKICKICDGSQDNISLLILWFNLCYVSPNYFNQFKWSVLGQWKTIFYFRLPVVSPKMWASS